MLNYGAIIIKDGMTETEIAERIIRAEAPIIMDGRTGVITKTLDEIVKEYYRKQDELAKQKAQFDKQQNNFATVPISEHRPAEIKIEQQ